MFSADAGAAQISMLSSRATKSEQPVVEHDPFQYLFPKLPDQGSYSVAHNGKCDIEEDFIMIAEFSEQEGPRPVIVIPKDGGQNFDQNEFSIKIMSVDHQSSVVGGYETAEDAQVVMCDEEAGTYAFVHHIVLNDIQARGYVRPFCISYVTSDPLKIMRCYEEISTQMKKVARFMKYGNRLVFMRDLEKKLEDLSYTKAHLLISQSRSAVSTQGDSELLAALNTIRQCMEEATDIVSALQPQLQGDIDLADRFQQYERMVQTRHRGPSMDSDSTSLQDFTDSPPSANNTKEHSGSYCDGFLAEFSLFSKSKNQKPKVLDVSAIRGKRRFDRSLRGLHELCSWGAKEGLQRLRAFREFLKQEFATIYNDGLDMAALDPESGVLRFGYHTVGANFLLHKDSGPESFVNRLHSFGGEVNIPSLGSVDSFKSFVTPFQSFDEDTMYSATSSLDNMFNYSRQTSVSDPPLSRNQSDPQLEDTELIFVHDYAASEFENTLTMENPMDEGLSKGETLDAGKTIADSHEQVSKDADRENKNRSDSDTSEFYAIDLDKDLKCSAKGCRCNTVDIKCDNQIGAGCRKTVKSRDEDIGRVKKTGICEVSEKVETDCDKLAKCNDENGYKKKISRDSRLNISNKIENFVLNLGLTDNTTTLCCSGAADRFEDVTDVSDVVQEQKVVSDVVNENKHLDDLLNAQKDIIDVVNGQKELTDVVNGQKELTDVVNGQKELTDVVNGQKELTDVVNGQKELTDVVNGQKELTDVVDGQKEPMDVDNKQKGFSDRFESDFESKDQYDLNESKQGNEDSSGDMFVFGKEPLRGSLTKRLSNSASSDSVKDESHLKKKWRLFQPNRLLLDGDFSVAQSLHKVLCNYSNLQHVVYSLLVGRPVIVIGTRKQESAIREMIQALALFVSSTPRTSSVCMLCQLKQLKMADIHKVQLRGIIRPDKRSAEYLLPQSIRRYITIVDTERGLILCQPYQGQFLSFLSALQLKKKTFKTGNVLLPFLQLCLEEISTKAFSYYHNVMSSDCLQDFRDASFPHRAAMLELSSEKYLNRAGIMNSDCRIIKHLAEAVKVQQIEEEFQCKYLTDAPAFPFSVQHQSLQTFKL
ncbi:uncharacterized protein LOC128239173 [Mya arenaria]|uniref:uncharacterized protein LOC128239173 n=1 Tax=Mya arenaria TaxID=6604 RepID=UPI0022E459B4|nr:uncharacterized protein LOC128239173 [Mya arenaria]